ncbi:MAG: asparagine synthase B [Firmicutes bacterium]|nr:asparagine synthase B [Bacillota bacterium]
MCGIIVSEMEVKGLESGLKKITKRGPDSSSVIQYKDNVFMFNRLAIMDLHETGMQPFVYGNNILVANAEIYNYKLLKNEYCSLIDFKGASDCEVLLPLYEQFKCEMFSMLDAEFAIVLYDSSLDGLIAARDPLGIRPLFYGKLKSSSKIVFASEAKAIIDIVDTVIPFPPGHYYKNGNFTKFTDFLDVTHYVDDSFEVILKEIRTRLIESVIKRMDSDAPLAYLLSGGLDSSLVCSIASRHLNKKIKTYSIGMDTDPIDLKYAKQVAKYLNTEHEEVIITKEQVLDSLEEVIIALETYDITTIRASVGMYLLSKHIHETSDVKVLLTGEVSDELFGYKYTDFAPTPEAFQRECVKRIEEIHMYDVLRADRCLASNSLEARVPFGDIGFVSYVMRIPPKFKMNSYNQGKYLLRKAFEGDFLPKEILYREKAAFSDAIGHSLVDCLKEYADAVYTDDEFIQLCQIYTNPSPFTKESLLYREIFERHYSGHSSMVKDFWMPNKEWPGCQVGDPSARVLSNYGKSGE